MDNGSRITTNFTYLEMGSPPLVYLPAVRDVCRSLEVIREHVGRPVIVTSGYRSPEHNRSVGGVPLSAHQTGNAADFRVTTYTSEQLALQALRCLDDYDQIVWYKKSRHVHLAVNGRLRRMFFCGD